MKIEEKLALLEGKERLLRSLSREVALLKAEIKSSCTHPIDKRNWVGEECYICKICGEIVDTTGY